MIGIILSVVWLIIVLLFVGVMITLYVGQLYIDRAFECVDKARECRHYGDFERATVYANSAERYLNKHRRLTSWLPFYN